MDLDVARIRKGALVPNTLGVVDVQRGLESANVASDIECPILEHAPFFAAWINQVDGEALGEIMGVGHHRDDIAPVYGARRSHDLGRVGRNGEFFDVHDERSDFLGQFGPRHGEEVVNDFNVLGCGARIEVVDVGGDFSRRVEDVSHARSKGDGLSAFDLRAIGKKNVRDSRANVADGIGRSRIAVRIRVRPEVDLDGLGHDVGMVQARGRIETCSVHDIVRQVGNGPGQTKVDFFARRDRPWRSYDAKPALGRWGQLELGERIAKRNDVVFIELRGGFVSTNRIHTCALMEHHACVAGERFKGATGQNGGGEDEREQVECTHQGTC